MQRAQMYEATRDGVGEIIAAAFGKPLNRLPHYARSEGAEQGLTGAALDNAIAGLRMQFPDRVAN